LYKLFSNEEKKTDVPFHKEYPLETKINTNKQTIHSFFSLWFQKMSLCK
jgi:hypothetical protein